MRIVFPPWDYYEHPFGVAGYTTTQLESSDAEERLNNEAKLWLGVSMLSVVF